MARYRVATDDARPSAPGTRPGFRWFFRASIRWSEHDLHPDLHETGRRGTHDLAERRARNVAVHRRRAVELRVVEDVERLDANLRHALGPESHALDERQVGIVDTRTMEEPARRVPQLTQRRQLELARIEGGALPRIVVDLQVAAEIVRRIEQIVVDAVAERAQQRRVLRVVERDRE